MRIGLDLSLKSGLKAGPPPDITAPVPVITSSETSPTLAATIPLTITFKNGISGENESVTGFEVGDIIVAGCTLGSLSGSGAVYTVTATPTAYDMTVDISAGVCVDGAGNANLTATQFTMTALSKWYLAGAVSAANAVAAYEPISVADLAASYVNKANPGTYNANVWNQAPSFTKWLGWAHGTNKALDTGYTPIAAGHSMIVFFRENGSNVIAGALSVNKFYVWNNISGARRYDYGNKNRSVSPALAKGSLAIAGGNCYANGQPDGAQVTPTWSGMNTRSIYVGGLNDASVLYFTGSIEGFALYSSTLTDAQVLAIHNAFYAIPRPYYKWANMPGNMTQHGMEVCGGKIYCAGGDVGKKLYEYDPATDAWTTKTDLPFAQTNRQSAIFRAVGSKLYFIGGYNDPTYYGNVYEYNPADNTWTEKTAMPTVREDMGSAVIGDKIYVFGGIGSGGNADLKKILEIYDVSDDAWTTGADMPAKKALGDFGVACNGYIYAIGATDDMTAYPGALHPVNTVYKYDPVGNSWSAVASIPAGTCYVEAEAVDDKIYVLGGANASFAATSAIYIYDTVNNTWSTSNVTLPIALHQAGLCSIGSTLYMSGGSPSNGRLFSYVPARL